MRHFHRRAKQLKQNIDVGGFELNLVIEWKVTQRLQCKHLALFFW